MQLASRVYQNILADFSYFVVLCIVLLGGSEPQFSYLTSCCKGLM